MKFIFDTINKLNINEPWNLLKLYKRDFKITLLHYPDFETYAYPALHTSITTDLDELTKRKANYQKYENPWNIRINLLNLIVAKSLILFNAPTIVI
tara:strand:+ start:572 stop:859 length:288 start_codon:yes stop_codon:yes gene_type:complete